MHSILQVKHFLHSNCQGWFYVKFLQNLEFWCHERIPGLCSCNDVAVDAGNVDCDPVEDLYHCTCYCSFESLLPKLKRSSWS